MRNAQFNESNNHQHHHQQEDYTEDDVVVCTRGGRVTFRMWDVQTGAVENCQKEVLKRMFGCARKAPETSTDWDFLLED